jgi:hypothetical protein
MIKMLRAVLFASLLTTGASAAWAAPSSKVQTLTPINDLEKLLIASATDATQRGAFVVALLQAQVCGVVEASNAKGDVGLLSQKTAEGVPEVLLYTAKERIATVFGPDTQYVCAQGASTLDALRGNNIVLDLGFDHGLSWSAADLDTILGTSRNVSSLEQVKFSPPDGAPPQLVSQLKAAFQPLPEVRTVLLAKAQWPSDPQPGWYLDVRSSLSDEKVQSLILTATANVDMKGLPLDVVTNAPGSPPTGALAIVKR